MAVTCPFCKLGIDPLSWTDVNGIKYHPKCVGLMEEENRSTSEMNQRTELTRVTALYQIGEVVLELSKDSGQCALCGFDEDRGKPHAEDCAVGAAVLAGY